MIKADFTYRGFKVRTHRQIIGCGISDTDQYWFRSIAWDTVGNVYRGETMPNRPDAQNDIIVWIDCVHNMENGY